MEFSRLPSLQIGASSSMTVSKGEWGGFKLSGGPRWPWRHCITFQRVCICLFSQWRGKISAGGVAGDTRMTHIMYRATQITMKGSDPTEENSPCILGVILAPSGQRGYC